jgi:hypothetical protein
MLVEVMNQSHEKNHKSILKEVKKRINISARKGLKFDLKYFTINYSEILILGKSQVFQLTLSF